MSEGPGTTTSPPTTGTSTDPGSPPALPPGSSPGSPTRDDSDGGVDPLEDAALPFPPVPVPEPMPLRCITDVSAGVHTFSCDGITHDLGVPEYCIRTQCGLIVDVHGGTMSSRMENKNTELQRLGGEHGFVVLQPSAFGGLWNASFDDAKVLAFARDVIEVFHLDERRIHMTGFSQGGYMTWRFACAHTDWLASVAPAAAAGNANISPEVGCTFAGSDAPSGPIPILYMHGTKDALVDFQNGQTLTSAVRAFYETGDAELVADRDGFRRERFTSAQGALLETIQHDYASASMVGVPPLGVAIVGHCYPGSDDQTPTEPGQLMAFGCSPPNGFHWGEEVLRFFLAHPRR
jgi:polyhydroxybutyrate depolymerase